jgi:hypothetical protein
MIQKRVSTVKVSAPAASRRRTAGLRGSYFSDPMLSLATLRQEAEEGRLPDRGLRSLSWRVTSGKAPSTPAGVVIVVGVTGPLPSGVSSSTIQKLQFFRSQRYVRRRRKGDCQIGD